MAQSIKTTIDTFRHLIKQTSDDSVYTDPFLYNILLMNRNELLRKHLNNGKHINQSLWKHFCMPLCIDSETICDCIDLGQKVLKSKYKVPKSFASNYMNYMEITTLDGNKSFFHKYKNKGKYNKYRISTTEETFYTIFNDYLYIVNHPTNILVAAMIGMVAEDPSDVQSIPVYALDDCNVCVASTSSCYDAESDTFQMPIHLIRPMILMSLEMLGVTLQLPDDTSNNADSTAQKI